MNESDLSHGEVETDPQYFETKLKKGHDNEEIADTCWSNDRSGVSRAG